MRRGKFQQSGAVDVETIPLYVAFQQVRQINEAPERHIRIPCALMLKKIDFRAEQERKVVFHAHINGVRYGVELQIVRVVVLAAVDRVVQGQRVLL